MKIITTTGTIAAILIAVASAAHADAVSDQKKAYQALGIAPKSQPAMCYLLSKAEVARFLGKPVRDGGPAGPVAGCAWHTVDGSNDGLLVMRGPRSDWYPPTHSRTYKTVAGIGEAAYVNYTDGLGYEAEARSAKGVTSVQISGKGTAQTALAILRTVVKR